MAAAKAAAASWDLQAPKIGGIIFIENEKGSCELWIIRLVGEFW